MKHSTLLKLGQIVYVRGLKCKIIDRDISDDQIDYLCLPQDPKSIVLGQDQTGAGWVYAENVDVEIETV